MNRKTTAVITALFGLFCLIGGLMGYIKAHSLPSLIAGTSSTIVLWLATPYVWRGRQAALMTVLVVSLLLDGRFIMAYVDTPKVMPHLVMIILSSITVLASAWTLVKRRRCTQ